MDQFLKLINSDNEKILIIRHWENDEASWTVRAIQDRMLSVRVGEDRLKYLFIFVVVAHLIKTK